MAVNKASSSLHFAPHAPWGSRQTSPEASWTPNTDVYYAECGLVIKVELAGMRREDLELTVEGRHLRIRGHRRDCCRPARCRFILMEINYGPFESVIELPAGFELSNAKASYQNGFLRIEVPLPSQPFSVPVESDDE